VLLVLRSVCEPMQDPLDIKERLSRVAGGHRPRGGKTRGNLFTNRKV
jgi:hypothetical protein